MNLLAIAVNDNNGETYYRPFKSLQAFMSFYQIVNVTDDTTLGSPTYESQYLDGRDWQRVDYDTHVTLVNVTKGLKLFSIDLQHNDLTEFDDYVNEH